MNKERYHRNIERIAEDITARRDMWRDSFELRREQLKDAKDDAEAQRIAAGMARSLAKMNAFEEAAQIVLGYYNEA